MIGTRLVLAMICTILIIILAIIHLGVSISILAKFDDYGSVFRPERGLAAFNIVISVYGLVIGIFGLFSVLTDRGNLSKIVGCASIVLVVFAMASLITALAIHSLSINYVSSRFSDYMYSYQTDQDSRNIIDEIQINYDCCGTNTWLDWSNIQLNSTGSGTATTTHSSGSATTAHSGGDATTARSGGEATTARSGGEATTARSGGEATTARSGGEATTAHSGGEATTARSGSEATTTHSSSGKSARSVERFMDTVENIEPEPSNNVIKTFAQNFLSSVTITDVFKFKRSSSERVSRRKRDTSSSYGGFYGLPTTYSVNLPQSCCSNTASSSSSSYCVSNANNNSNSIRTDGCSKKLAQSSTGQSIGLSVINSFLVCIALATIPVLFEKNPFRSSPKQGMIYHSDPQYHAGPQYQPQYGQMAYNQPYDQSNMYYGNNNPGYNLYL